MEKTTSCEDCRNQKAQQLIEAYCITDNLPQLTELSSQIIGMPLHITDCSYKILAQSSLGIDEDAVWRDNADLGYLSSRIIADVLRIHRPVKPVRPGDRIFFTWTSKISSYPMLVYYLFHSGVLLGHLSALCVHGEPSEQDYYLMSLLSDLLAKYLYMNKAGRDMGEKPYESILTALIETDVRDADVLENRALATGLKAYDSFYILNVSVEENFSVLKERLIKTFPYSRVFYYEHQMMALLPYLGEKRCISGWELEQIGLLSEEMDARICISDEFHSISELSIHYRKNQRILELSRLYRNALLNKKLFYPIKIFEDKIYHYDQFKHIDMIYRLFKAEDRLDLREYVNNAIRSIYDYDIENGTNMLQTLMIFIECQKSYVGTAEKMLTHKNTIRYRIEKMKEMLSSDLLSGGEMQDLYLSCVLLQLREILK